MPAGAPDGIRPPTLTAASSQSILAVWGPPSRINGPDTPGVFYQLYFRRAGVLSESDTIFPQFTG